MNSTALATLAGLAVSCHVIAQPMPAMAIQPSGSIVVQGRSISIMGEPGAMSMDSFESDDFEDEGGEESDGSEMPQPKTPLGKLLVQQPFNRSPEGVLMARAALAAKLREERLKPPAVTPAKEHAPDAEVDAVTASDRPIAAEGSATVAGEATEAESPATATLGGKPSKPKDPNARPPTKDEMKLAERYNMLVTAGRWEDVAAFLQTNVKEDAVAVYTFLLAALARDSAIVPDEVIAISEVAPGELTDKMVDALGGLLRSATQRGADGAHVALLIKAGTKHFGGEDPAARTRAARFLMAADLPVEAHPYLEPLAEARKTGNAAVINLHAMYEQGLAARKKELHEKNAAIRRSWDLCLEVLRIENSPQPERSSALVRALGFLDQVTPDVANAWLAEVFQGEPDLAWALVERTNMAARQARGMGRSPDDRVRLLAQLRRVGAALAEHSGERLPEYRAALDMMTLSILEEAEDTSNQRRDERFQFIPPDQLAGVLPTAAWLLAVDPGLAGRLELMSATVAAGAGNVEGVLAMIRPLLATDKERAQKLADSLVEAWPNYVKPQSDSYDPYGYGGVRSYYNGRMMSYGGYYGGNGYDGGVPLTRARQKRYTEQLGLALQELKTLGLSTSPASVVAAFSASHSDAEVYTREDIEALFGKVDTISPEVGVELGDEMRRRLGSLWRSAKTQQENGTKRNDKQIAAEVVRGYTLALDMAAASQLGDPRSWRAATLIADLSFDKAEFLYGQKIDLATYSTLREEAFSAYSFATKRYRESLDEGKTAPSARVYVQWLSSALGASDLGFLTRQDQPSYDQIDKVIGAINELPEPARGQHVGLFAQSVKSSLQSLAPELKVRFLTHAARVIGDHADGADVRKQLAYYNDLKTEVELNLAIDGGTQVGNLQPFGANFSVWSSRAVSRESGGFGKYLLNQQWHPQTGQPVDYKDDLEKKLRQTLSDRFEIVSITFHKPGVTPMGVEREGWEQHPLAYLLLRSKDGSVDKVPPLQLDMDFSDGQGTVILPMTTTAALIDSRTEPPTRVPEALAVEQILDAREEGKGVVKLEVQAKASGLIPSLDSIVDLSKLEGFSIIKTEDHGMSISELDTNGDAILPLAERSWTLELAPAGRIVPASFTFPTAKFNTVAAAGSEVVPFKLSRYTDADIGPAQATEPINVTTNGLPLWVPALLGVSVLAGVGILAIALRRKKPVSGPVETFTVPSELTPLSAIATLRRIAASPKVGLDAAQRASLAASAESIERNYFSPTAGEGLPVEGIDTLRVEVKRWVDLAESRIRR